MYLQTYFSNLVNGVNQIYTQINDPLISFQIEMVKFSIEKHEHEQIGSERLEDINDHFKKYYTNHSIDCDHIFFVLNYTQIPEGQQRGIAFHSDICKPDRFTSISQIRGYYMETTLAHELAHNLGVSGHDNDPGNDPECKGYLLNSSNGDPNDPKYWKLSSCSMNLIKKNLLDNKNKLKKSAACLKQENSKTKLKTIPDVNYLSLSDQCRFYLEDMNSYCCEFPRDMCSYIMCYSSENHDCTAANNITRYNRIISLATEALDGSVCGVGKECHLGKCKFVEKKQKSKTKINKLKESADLLREKCPAG
jgi:hypothetical protein